MRVKVLLFGVLRDLLGRTEHVFLVQPGATVGDLIDLCRKASNAESVIWDSIAVAINQEYSARERVLIEGDEIALLPPVSGGRD